MKKIKIVEFIGRIQDGGAETLVKDYVLLMDKDKFDITVLCEDYNSESNVYKTLVENKVHIYTMYQKSFFINKVMARLFGKRHIARLFERAIKDLRPDIIHAHLELLEVLYYASDCIKDIKLFFTCHNPPQKLIGNGNPKERDACRFLLDNNDLRIIALHDTMAEEIEEMFNIDNVSVIKNGIDIERFSNVNINRKDKRNELGIPEDAYVVGQVGRFAYQKNPEFTVMLFDELHRRKPNSYLLLVGRGKMETQLRNQIKKSGLEEEAKMLISRDDIPELLKTMDVFILPSRFEGFGIALVEAQAAGLPCVVSENVPSQVYLSQRVNRLYLNDDCSKWVNALLDPKGNIEKWGDINEYDIRKEIKNLEKLYLS